MTGIPEPDDRARRSAAAWARWLPYALLVLAAVFWAGNWVVGRAARDYVPPVALTFWRWAVACALLAPIALPRLRGRWSIVLRHWALLLVLGTTGIVIFTSCVYFGLSTTTAVNAVLFNASAPIAVVGAAWIIEQEEITARQALGLGISMLGILVVMTRGDFAQLMAFELHRGDVWILAGMPAWGVYSVLLQRRPREIEDIGLLFVIGLAALIVLLPLYAIEFAFHGPFRITLEAVGAIGYVAIFASIGAFACWNRGVAAIGPNRAAFTMPLIPFFGTVMAIVTLGEAFQAYHFVGFATILAGVALATSARRAATHGRFRKKDDTR